MDSQLEELILAIERAYLAIPDLETRIVAAEQSLAMWWVTLGFNSTPATCVATITGTVIGVIAGLAGKTVTIKDHASGTTLGTTTTGSGGAAGQFSVAVTITPGQSVDIFLTSTGFDSLLSTITASCGTNAQGNIFAVVSTGYVGVNTCNEPIPTSLQYIDPIYGTFTVPFVSHVGTVFTWSSTVAIAYPGAGVAAGGCGAVGALNYTLKLQNGVGGWGMSNTWGSVSNVNNCPLNGGFTRTTGGTLGGTTCPPGFAVTFAISAVDKLYSGIGATVTWQP